MAFPLLLKKSLNEKTITEKIYLIFSTLYENYKEALTKENIPFDTQEKIFETFLEKVKEEIAKPSSFSPFHKAVRSPFDYYHLGTEFIRALVDSEKSEIFHIENVEKMQKEIQRRENIVLLSNHQTEVDPQLLTIILEKKFPRFAEEMIFVAGDRVITDPMAVPFSKGRNLLCIYSKRHIDSPPEKKLEKQQHNRKTMHLLKELLQEGGKAVYVAPSGGRDRPNAEGKVQVAPFDPQSIEMFRLMAQEAKTPTHFYPLALFTYDILPPPPSVESELGEMRKPKRVGIFFSFGNEIDMNTFPGSDLKDRHEKRAACAHHIWNLVKNNYEAFKK